MRAGSLRKVGMLQKRSPARDSFGGAPAVWQDVGKVRFAIEMTAGRQIESAGNVRATATATITMRWQPGVEPGMRIRADANDSEPVAYFNITALDDVARRHRVLELTVMEDRTAVA